MNGETVFTVVGSRATVAQPIGLAEAGLTERAHLQEWVLAHPQVLGTDVKIVASEFGRWTDASGGVERDRLDVLGLDRDGRLVVVELKRDKAPDTVDMQALKYAALVSRFTRDRLGSVHAQYLTRVHSNPIESEAALADLEEWAPLDEETLRLPRIVLIASSFPTTVTATVVFLSQQLGLDVRLLAFQAYQTVNDVIVTVSQHYPPPDVEDFVLSPEVSEQRRARVVRQTRNREANTVPRLVEAGVLDPGTTLTFGAPSADQEADLKGWLDAVPSRRKATWLDEVTKPLQWEADGQPYSPTGLTQHILEAATGRAAPTQGTLYWHIEDGRSLVELAANQLDAVEVPLQTHLDGLPADLHQTYEAVNNALMGLGSDMSVRSRARGLAYFGQRKIADLRFRQDHVSLYVRGLERDDPIAVGLGIGSAARHLHVQARKLEDVAGLMPLLEKAYATQAA